MFKKNRILIFIDWFLPAYKAGGPIRSIANMVEFLHEDYDFYIFTSNKDLNGEAITVTVNQWISFGEKHKIANVFYASNCSYSIVYKTIKEINPDSIYLNSLFSLYYTVCPLIVDRLTQLKRTSIVIAPRGMFQKGALQLKQGRKRSFLRVVKPLLFKRSNIVWQATDEQEREDIKEEMGKECKVELVANVPSLGNGVLKDDRSTDAIRFVTISLVTKKKNHIYFLEQLSHLRIPEEIKIIYDIYGPVKDVDYWEQCLAVVKQLPENIKVNYKGSIEPVNVSNTLQQYHCFVLPTLGENFGHAIFEALVNGVPVLISDQTPWHDLQRHEAGWSISLKQDKEWTLQLENMLNGKVNWSALSKGAKVYAQEYIKGQNLSEAYGRLFGS